MKPTMLALLVAAGALLTVPSSVMARDARYSGESRRSHSSSGYESRSATHRSPSRHGHGSKYRYHTSRSRVSVHGGIWWGPAWGPWALPYGYYYYPAHPLYGFPPPVIPEAPVAEYLEQDPEVEADDFLYYCRDPKGYYPDVPRCPGGWQKVDPEELSPAEEE